MDRKRDDSLPPDNASNAPSVLDRIGEVTDSKPKTALLKVKVGTVKKSQAAVTSR
jgi:hypothetical protein